MSAAPVRIVERYLFDLYNAQNVDLVHELCGDPLIRHAAGTVTTMTRSEQVDRIAADLAAHKRQWLRPERMEIFVVGDMIALDNLPGVAQVAIQGV